MQKKSWMVCVCALILSAAVTGGCGNGNRRTETSGSGQTERSEKSENRILTVKVTEMNGMTVRAETGELTQMSGGEGEPMAKPEGSEAPPAKPEENETPPEKPEGDEILPENGPDSCFEPSGEQIIFLLTDSTGITVEYLQGSREGTAEDIVEGSILSVELDEEDKAADIVVKNLNGGGGFGGSGEVTNGTAAETIENDVDAEGKSYLSEGDNENALRVDGAKVTLEDIQVWKTGGSSSNTEDGDFYGQNAAFLACNGAQVTIKNAEVNSEAVNGNGVFSYGEGTVIRIADSVIRTAERNSGGIQTTGGGTTIAENLDIETQGNSSAAIRSDRGGGTVRVNGGQYVTNGVGSPAIYSTADIAAENAVLKANASEGIVVEGKNKVSLKNCTVSGSMKQIDGSDAEENIHGIMIYQSMSGDAAVGEASFSAQGGCLETEEGELFYVTNTECTIELTNVVCKLANDVLLRVEGKTSPRGWGTQGANGGDVEFTAREQEINGNILVDEISSLKLKMEENTKFCGAVNPDGEKGSVTVYLDDSSVWILTGDSYIDELDGDTEQIRANGYHLYVGGKEIV